MFFNSNFSEYYFNKDGSYNKNIAMEQIEKLGIKKYLYNLAIYV